MSVESKSIIRQKTCFASIFLVYVLSDHSIRDSALWDGGVVTLHVKEPRIVLPHLTGLPHLPGVPPPPCKQAQIQGKDVNCKFAYQKRGATFVLIIIFFNPYTVMTVTIMLDM